MLDAFIIEELRRREREAERQQDDRSLRLPVPGRESRRTPERSRGERHGPKMPLPADDARDPYVVDFTL